MGLAPTEKHIEDWIVNNHDEFNCQTDLKLHRLIGRQLQFPSGIADLVYAASCGMWVIEIKKGKINGDSVSQLSHYLTDLKAMHFYLQCNIEFYDDPHYHSDRMTNETGLERFRGVLIGTSIDRHAALACEGMDIETIFYDYNDDKYEFERYPEHEYHLNPIDSFHPDVVSGIKEVMRHLCLYDNDMETLKNIYKQEGWIK